MKIRYSKNTGAFYPLDIHYAELPGDIQEVGVADYEAAMSRPSDHSFLFDAGKLVISAPPPKSIETLKAEKNAEINAARLAANATTFIYQGKLIACDALSRGDIDATAIKVARSGKFPKDFPGGWKAVDNSIIPLQTVEAWDAFYDAMTDQGTANFAKSQALKAQLQSATTAEQIALIKW